MSARRKSYALKGGHRLVPQGVISDFPIPNCSECKGQMVKLEGRWGCPSCTELNVLRPLTTEVENGQPITRLVPVKLPLQVVHPNRAARRAVGR